MTKEDFFTIKNGAKLRNGFTTGTCAAAAAKAAAYGLLSGLVPAEVSIETPSGKILLLPVTEGSVKKTSVRCSVVKDAGDDPDVTDGIKISALVSKISEGFEIDGGKGVGRASKPGLPCKVGEAAINPVPRAMIEKSLREAAEKFRYPGGLKAVISAEGGEERALKTFNPRLGIEGGISILGTSGIVEPMSEKALIDSIRMEMDLKIASGAEDLLLCPGNYGRDLAFSRFGIDMKTGVKCSNYIGESLDYALYLGVRNVLLMGHAGKLIKLAGGVMNTHSRYADCRREIFAAHAGLAGASRDVLKNIMETSSADEIDAILLRSGFREAVWDTVMEKIEFYLKERLKGGPSAQAVVFTNREGDFRMTSGASILMEKIKARSFPPG